MNNAAFNYRRSIPINYGNMTKINPFNAKKNNVIFLLTCISFSNFSIKAYFLGHKVSQIIFLFSLGIFSLIGKSSFISSFVLVESSKSSSSLSLFSNCFISLSRRDIIECVILWIWLLNSSSNFHLISKNKLHIIEFFISSGSLFLFLKRITLMIDL